MKDNIKDMILKLALTPEINQKTREDLCAAWANLQRRNYFPRRYLLNYTNSK